MHHFCLRNDIKSCMKCSSHSQLNTCFYSPCCVSLPQLHYESTKEHPVSSLYSPSVAPVLSHALSLSILLAMEELDGDEVRVSSRGRLAERDIVQVLIIILFNFRRLDLSLFPSTAAAWGSYPRRRMAYIHSTQWELPHTLCNTHLWWDTEQAQCLAL